MIVNDQQPIGVIPGGLLKSWGRLYHPDVQETWDSYQKPGVLAPERTINVSLGSLVNFMI